MSILIKGQQIKVGQIKLLVQDKLGRGAFGTVYKVCDKERNAYALKVVKCKNPSSINKVIPVIREANALAKAKHERIVQILETDQQLLLNKESLFLILTEFCSGGDLNSRLNKPSTEKENLNWICQISEALSYLHSLHPPIVHRDLKADNVLQTNHATEDLKLGDFGLAREYLSMKNYDCSSKRAQIYYMTSGFGPIHWMAPEFYHERYTEKADVFSLGGIFYAILTRDFIQIDSRKMYGVFLSYPSLGKVGLGYAMANINPNAEVIFPPHFQGSMSMKILIQKMLSYHPNNRPSASEVKDSVEKIRYSIELGNDPSHPDTRS